MNSTLTKKILHTIIYYDIFNFPLTSFELWKYLFSVNPPATLRVAMRAGSEQRTVNSEEVESFTLGEIFEALDDNELKSRIEEYRGFYFLKGRKELVEQRIQNDKNSIRKFKIAERAVWWLRFVPFVRMVAVTGTLAMKNSEKDSDIDFFVVLEKGRIFTGRLLVTAMAHLLGKRRYGNKIKNRICLNYFITTGSLEIKRQDLFAANEYSFIYPVFDSLVISSEAKRSREIYVDQQMASHQVSHEDPSTALGMTKKSVFCQFGEANIGWIKKYKPNFEFSELVPVKYYVRHSKFSRFIQKTREALLNFIFGDRMEIWLKKKQVARIERNPLTYKRGGYVEYDDENLIFLPEPQGHKIFEKYKEKLKKIESL